MKKRSRITLLVVSLVLFIILVGMTVKPAFAKGLSDSDGHVPVLSMCDYSKNASGQYTLGTYMRTVWTWKGDVVWVEGKIYLNTCVLHLLRAGPNDWWRLYWHERGHADGWEHWEKNPGVNPSYWPTIIISRT